MPYAHINGVRLYYEVHGSGEPMLWIGGLGANVLEIPYLIEVYRRQFQLTVFDSRGCGRSESPDGEYTIPGFADDTAGLLDALAVNAALVYGSSMGGMIAQELAIRHPARVRALILGCTTAGVARGAAPSPDTVQRMARNQTLSGDEALSAGWELGYSPEYIAAHYDALLARSREAARYAASRDSYLRQAMAAARHDAYDRLAEIRCPVMIIHGTDDVMVPVDNAYLLKQHIPHAELHVLDGLGHGYNLEGQAIADPLVIGFFQRCSTGAAEDVARAVR